MVSTQIAHENQLLPIVRYWIPDVEIVEPEYLVQKHRQQLTDHLQKEKKSNLPSENATPPVATGH
jgi:predicted DNA-binding transcriptional regulator YafY